MTYEDYLYIYMLGVIVTLFVMLWVWAGSSPAPFAAVWAGSLLWPISLILYLLYGVYVGLKYYCRIVNEALNS